jgi:hypothetical protein
VSGAIFGGNLIQVRKNQGLGNFSQMGVPIAHRQIERANFNVILTPHPR